MSRNTLLPPVLGCLAEEHRHMAALLKLLDQRAGHRKKLKLSDYYLMRDVVGYLHEYPDVVHHPTEDLLFSRVLEYRPDLGNEVAALQTQHREVFQESRELLEQLDHAVSSPAEAAEQQIRKRAQAFARKQEQHMQLENRSLFPAALAEFKPADWKVISRRVKLHNDPLFGATVQAQHRPLFEYLLDMDGDIAGNLVATGIDSQERLMMALAAVERGTRESLVTLLGTAGSMKDEVQQMMFGKRRPGSLMDLAFFPWRSSALMGRHAWTCGKTLLSISVSSGREVCGVLLERERK